MRRLFALLMALSLFAVACGGSDETGSGSDTTTPSTATTPAATDVDNDPAAADTSANAPDADVALESDDVAPAGLSVETVAVGYRTHLPTPNLAGVTDGSFGQSMGGTVNWIPFDSEAAMTAALEAGEIDISYGQSLSAFVDAIAGGVDISMVAIGAAYPEAAGAGSGSYDVVSVPTSFGLDHGDVVVAFLATTERFNTAWGEDPTGVNPAIAEAAGLDDVDDFLGVNGTLAFPTLADQLSRSWLRGTVADELGDVAIAIDTSFAEEAADLVRSRPSNAAGSDDSFDDDVATGYVPPVDLIDTEITVGYFEQWPTPNLFGLDDESFDLFIGADVVWVPFSSGTDMAAALEAGEIEIAYSLGLTSFVTAVNEGADLSLVGIAVAHQEGDNCVAQGGLGVTRENAAEVLDGASVMVPSDGVLPLKMALMMDSLGVDRGSLTIVEADSGPATSAAFAATVIDVGCASGGSLTQMLGRYGGNLIMTGAEQAAESGLDTYGVVAISSSYGEQHGDVVVAFLGATQVFNDTWQADPGAANPTIANASRMADVGNFLSGPTWFSFPSIEEQLSPTWLTGAVASNMVDHVEALARVGQVESTVADFSGFIDASFLEEALAG